MAISYSGLTNYGKTSLPSVSSWSTNNNILRDPPRSFTTQRKDKVGDNSFITQEIDCSSDRAAEAILAFPRGINPMVEVSYTDFNGGVGRGQALLYGSRLGQGKLPYRVADRGAFRAPILAPVDLLPFSRLPRNITKIDPIIFNPDYSKKITCGAEKRTTKDIPHISTTGSRVYIRGKEQMAKFVGGNIKKHILNNTVTTNTKNIPKVVHSGKLTKTMKHIPQYNIDTNKKYMSFKTQRAKYIDNSIKSQLKGDIYTNKLGNREYNVVPKHIARAQNVIQYETFSNKKYISGKEQRSKFVSPMIIDAPIHARAQTSQVKHSTGGLLQEDFRGPNRLVAIRRGALVLPDDKIDTNSWGSNIRPEIHHKTKHRLIPVSTK